MPNYAVGIPHDVNRQDLQGYPAPVKAKAVYAKDTTATTSSVISTTHDTTVVEITAVGTPAFIRWVATTDTGASVISTQGTANFDHAIPPNKTQRFVIPIETATTNPQSIQGANRLNGLYQRYAIKSAGAASSIIAVEF